MPNAPIGININLDPASVLYLNAVSLRTHEQIPPTARALPRFSFSIEKRHVTGQTDKAIAKQFMVGLAGAWRAMQTPDRDNACVALIKVDASDDAFGFEAMT